MDNADSYGHYVYSSKTLSFTPLDSHLEGLIFETRYGSYDVYLSGLSQGFGSPDSSYILDQSCYNPSFGFSWLEDNLSLSMSQNNMYSLTTVTLSTINT